MAVTQCLPRREGAAVSDVLERRSGSLGSAAYHWELRYVTEANNLQEPQCIKQIGLWVHLNSLGELLLNQEVLLAPCSRRGLYYGSYLYNCLSSGVGVIII